MTPELSRLHRVETIPATGVTINLSASPVECAAIALRLGIPGLRSLTARLELRAVEADCVEADARFTARLVRDCVVSLDPFETTQRESFKLRFVPAGAESDQPDPESEDEIPYDGGVIDLGEAVVEQLALDLDPFPRKDGAVLPEAAEPSNVSPFAALAALRAKR